MCKAFAVMCPHPLVTEMDNLHVCFVTLRKSIPIDVKFILAVKQGKGRDYYDRGRTTVSEQRRARSMLVDEGF